MQYLSLVGILLVLVASCTPPDSARTNVNESHLSALPAAPTVEANSDRQSRSIESTKEQEIWTGHSGDFDFRWTTKDLYVTGKGRTEAIFSEYAKEWARQNMIDQREATNIVNFRILSLVGDLISVEIDEIIAGDNSATVTTEVSWITIDLSKRGRIAQSYQEDEDNIRNANLTGYFHEKDILNGILKNDDIRNKLISTDQPLPKVLRYFTGPKRTFPLGDHGDFALNGYSLNKFVFEDADSGGVSILLELLQFDSHVGSVRSLGVRLPIYGDLVEPLRRAREGEQGFLLNNNPVQAREMKTEFVFRSN
jgi:hypothetical protein